MNVHVERPTLLKQRSGMTFCGLAMVSNAPVISTEELRRRTHTFGRAATEAATCPKCYALARPKTHKGPRLPRGPKKPKASRPADSGLGKLDSKPWRAR